MKKPIFVVLICTFGIDAFAQGRLSFVNDSLHLVYYALDLPGLGGQPVSATNMPSGLTLIADLYLGTSSSSLSLISSTTFSGTSPGKWNSINLSAPGISGGTTVYVVTQIRDTRFAAEATWTPTFQPFGLLYGRSEEFTFVLGTSTLLYPAMYNHAATQGGGLSTWSDGTYNMDFLAAGMRGAIIVGIPEPSSFVLGSLGAAAMLAFRRRK